MKLKNGHYRGLNLDTVKTADGRLNILISAYACGPKWGSEVGMGWNWVINLARHCDITVLTEEGFRKDIEETLPSLDLAKKPVFYYIDAGEKGRELFWKQGSILFYYYYWKWQLKAYNLSLRLVRENKFNLIHQLNMLGFREPGYIWKIKNIPLIWGPIGGFAIMPWSYLPSMGFRAGIFFLLKNLINIMQMHSNIRVRRAFNNFDVFIASTDETKKVVQKIYGRECIVINETGAKYVELPGKKIIKDKTVLLWCGYMTGRKALPLALKALSLLPSTRGIEFHIIGEGPSKNYCINLAKKLNINQQCIWHGRLTNEEVLNQMKNSDLLVFTSLIEGTPHVVLEALSCSLPVVCHDTCGQGAVVDDSCGIKVPVVSPEKSIEGFTAAIEKLINDRELLKRLSEGARKRARELSWEGKAEQLVTVYRKAISDFNIRFLEEGERLNEDMDHPGARSLAEKHEYLSGMK